MNAMVGWALAAAALVLGYVAYGWPGLFLAFTVIVFWLLLQFSRALRTLRQAGNNPVGSVPNAVMLNAKLQKGWRLPDVLKLTQSLGRRIGESEQPEVWAWADAAGDEVQVQLQDGRVTAWNLIRVASLPEAPAA
jgi:uncharacterized protein (DUF58 family)